VVVGGTVVVVVEGGDDVVVVATVVVIVEIDRGAALLEIDELHAPVATSNTTAQLATRERGGTSS